MITVLTRAALRRRYLIAHVSDAQMHPAPVKITCMKLWANERYRFYLSASFTDKRNLFLSVKDNVQFGAG